mgnify:CR=1 FL=1
MTLFGIDPTLVQSTIDMTQAVNADAAAAAADIAKSSTLDIAKMGAALGARIAAPGAGTGPGTLCPSANTALARPPEPDAQLGRRSSATGHDLELQPALVGTHAIPPPRPLRRPQPLLPHAAKPPQHSPLHPNAPPARDDSPAHPPDRPPTRFFRIS